LQADASNPLPEELGMSEAATQFQPGLPGVPPAPPSADRPAPARAPAAVRPRIWPGTIIVALMWAAILVPGQIPALQGTRFQVNTMLFGSMIGAGAVGLWWLFASRVHWTDRLLLLLVFGTSAFTVMYLAHPSFIYMNYGPIIRGLPMGSSALVLWLWLTPRMSWPARRLGAALAILLAWAYCDLVRLDGVWGDFQPQVSWRWELKPEQRYAAYLAARKGAATAAVEKAVALRPGDWPGFRGADRDGRLNGVQIATDWKAWPPKQLWKQPIGPGWSSYAVVGDRAYTQEQRENDEAVVCYDVNTGAEVWNHVDATRFYEEIGGAGPRSTPTFADGKLYTFGANGKLNCLDPATGKPVWSRDVAADSGAKVPKWGFSSSPLVAQGIVTVFAGGPDGKSVLGYHASSGELAWSAGDGTDGYSSPHLEHLHGVDQIVVASDKGLTAFEPAGGKVLWKHDWTMDQTMPRVAQPTPIGDSDVLLGTQMVGMRRVHVGHEGDAWSQSQVWETKAIKPYYNDLVVYKDHAYGFDGNFFTCVALEDGKSKWRARGYGNGQVLLLADQGLLLISTEKGEIALVRATPERHQELGRFKAIEGKTWNHPVLSHGKLLIRNGEEAACFQIAEDAAKSAE
jgi:outer membrane protein assembly factor BamB